MNNIYTIEYHIYKKSLRTIKYSRINEKYNFIKSEMKKPQICCFKKNSSRVYLFLYNDN